MRFAILAILSGCLGSGPVDVRACNATGYDFSDLHYGSFAPSGSLADGACTAYERAPSAMYRYTYVRFAIGADVFEIQPIDYVGETPLDDGLWSYRLTIVDYTMRDADIRAIAD